MALKQDSENFSLFPEQGNKIESAVLDRVRILGFFVLNRVGVSNRQRLTYTQIFGRVSPTPPPGL